MSKVQTFEEWFAASKRESEVRAVARNVWKAAHENAALVCDTERVHPVETGEESDYAYNHAIDHCMEAIREAGKS